MKLQLSPGKKLMGWLLVRKLGEGAFGQVWYAQADGGFGETALKFIDATGDNREKAKREYTTLKMMCENRAFQSSRLIKLQGVWLLDEDEKPIPDAKFGETVFGATMMMDEVGPLPDALMIQMDLAQSNLAELLDSTIEQEKESEVGGLPIADLLPFMYQAAKGIDFLNRTPRIFHCDIKPENLLLVDGEVKICDYGGARKEGIERKNKKNVLSLAHASPELMNNAPCEYSDQYSLAITYVQLRTGRLPYSDTVLRSRSVSTVRDAVLRGDLDLSALPPVERAVIKRATSLKPERRFPTATAMAVELDRAINHGGTTGRKGLLIGALAVVLLAGGVAALRPWNWLPKPTNGGGGSSTVGTNGGGDKPDDPPPIVPIVEDQEKLAQEIAAAIDGAMKLLDQPSIAGTDAESSKRELTALAGRIADLKDDKQRTQLSQLRELALARLALFAAWPNAEQPPQGAVQILKDKSSPLWTAQRRDDIAGLSPSAWETLLALRALEAWPGRDAELASEALSSAAAPLAAIRHGDNKLAALERARCAALEKKLRDAVTRAQSSGAPLPADLTASLEDLFGADFLFGIALENVFEAARREAGQTGEFKAAQAQAEMLTAIAQDDQQLLAKVPWYVQFAKLGNEDAPTAMVYLGQNPGDAPRQQAIADVLRKRFVRAAIHESPLALVAAATALSQRLTAATDPAPERLQAMLLAQQLAARSALPERPGNSWNDWAADCQSLEKLLNDQRAALAREPADSWVGLPLVDLCQIELAATLARDAESPDAAALRTWRDRLEALRKDADAFQRLDESQLPGYFDYVSALVASLETTSQAAALTLPAVYTTANGALVARSPGLDWPERRDTAARILVAAAQELRNKPFDDLSLDPLSAESAAEAVVQLELAAELSPTGLSPADQALLALAKSTSAAAADKIALIEPVLQVEGLEDSPLIAQLLIESALAHAELAQGPGDAQSQAQAAAAATGQFAQALRYYSTWSDQRPPDTAALERLNTRVLKTAWREAQRFVPEPREANVNESLAEIAIVLADVKGELYRKRRLRDEPEVTAELIADWYRLANDLSPQPRAKSLAAEGAWLRDMLARRSRAAALRLIELKTKITATDPDSSAVRGIAAYYEYRHASDWPERLARLEESLKLFNQAIGAATDATPATARFYLDRGGVQLQLAYVYFKAQNEIGDANESIRQALEGAIRDSEVASDERMPDEVRIEALNLRGNSWEDLFFYQVDADREAIEADFKNAETAFESAYQLNRNDAEAAFNAARCRFRYERAKRLYFGAEGLSDRAAKQGLEQANQAIETAMRVWGDSVNDLKAEALYWQSEIQEELGEPDNLALAESLCGQAAQMAFELSHSNWASYQRRWAVLARNAGRPADALARVQAITDPAGDASNRPAVDKSSLAAAVDVLIRWQRSAVDAKQAFDAKLASFQGNDATSAACKARLRLALASVYQASPQHAKDAEKEAEQVLALTAPPQRFPLQAVMRSQANFLLGRAKARQLGIAGASPADIKRIATDAAKFHADGMKDVAAASRRNLEAQEIWVSHAMRWVEAAIEVAKITTERERKVELGNQLYKTLDELDRRMDAALPDRKINGKKPAEWKDDTAFFRTFLAERGFNPPPRDAN